MNTYKITFTRENGTVGSDNFTAPSEAQARRDFKEVYRHGNGTITSVELVSSDAPATKQQERAALEKIRKIVAELGPDSYIATAFAGCFEIAAENIENDFADSMKERYEQSREDAAHFKAAADSFSAELDKLRSEHASLKSELESAREIAIHNAKQCDEARNDIGEYQRRAEEAEAEVIRLKAKLYDYIVAGA
jgi:chromosome segregation ATPase|nr:MAG: hypothetical protein [Bacteriophage sp.]